MGIIHSVGGSHRSGFFKMFQLTEHLLCGVVEYPDRRRPLLKLGLFNSLADARNDRHAGARSSTAKDCERELLARRSP